MTLYKLLNNGEKEYKESGSRVEAISWNDDRSFNSVVDHKPTVGCSLLVGSVTARSYSDQDYWLTTLVTEIIEETSEHIKFKTQNSEYILEK